MPRRLQILLLLICAALVPSFAGCKEIEQAFLADDTPVEPCDPTYSTYHGYVHFIERDFLTRDQTLDYRKWFDTNRVDASDCDPLKVRAREEAARRQKARSAATSPAPENKPASNSMPVDPDATRTPTTDSAAPETPAPAQTPAP